MKKIVIIGSSSAGVKIIEAIRSKGSEDEITVITLDGHYPYERNAFASFIAKDITPEEVFCKAKDFYDQNNVNVVLDKKITRINVKRRTIFMEDKERFEYDICVITDTPENRFPGIKGANKTGVYGVKKLKDMDHLFGVIPVYDLIVIQSDTFVGLQIAAALVKRGKEVIFVTSRKGFITTQFGDYAAQWLVTQFEKANVRIMRDDKIEEILGDKDAKAVRIKDGKVYSAQAIILTEGEEDLRLFTDTGLQMNKRIEVNDQFRTNIESIFAIDQVSAQINSEPITPIDVLDEQGLTVAAAINGETRPLQLPVESKSLSMDGLIMSVLGKVETGPEIEVQQLFDQELGQYKAIYIQGEQFVGAVLINMESEKDELLRLITEKGCVQTEEAGQIGQQDVSPELVDN